MSAENMDAVRCAWGTAQESAGLLAMLEAMPGQATLEEVGLVLLSPESEPSPGPACTRPLFVLA